MQTRRGDAIYDNGKLVAELKHGSWCKPKYRTTHITWEPVDPDQAAAFDKVARPSLSSSEGEQEVLGFADKMISSQVLGPSNRTKVFNSVQSRLVYGLNKHGPFVVDGDDRDLERKIRSSAADTVIYACMRLTQKPEEAHRIEQVAKQAIELLDRIENGG
jgi:hypothetical protein